MKYLNSLVFLGLMVMVAGCQKKDKVQPKKTAGKSSAKVVKDKKGPKKLEAKKVVDKKKACKACKCKPGKSSVKVQGYGYWPYDGSGE